MNIIPKLNLNHHYKDCTNYSLVDARNMMIQKDSTTLCNENDVIAHPKLNEFFKNNRIVYCTPCNNEIILYTVNETNDKLHLYRYNEKSNNILDLDTEIEYSPTDTLQSTYVYNKNELIIAIAADNKPLRVLNLGDNVIPSIPINKQLICPEVRIPTVECSHINGNAYKGWYYVFIRFKISNNNYTQWFNTNSSIFIDSTVEKYIEDYTLYGKNLMLGINITGLKYINETVTTNISNDSEIANKSFKCSIDNLNLYDEYQLGFIIVRKDSTKCFRTNDLKSDDFYFNLHSIIEESLQSMISSYNNYYNVKTLDNYNNTLYIANYEELNYEEDTLIEVKDINLSIEFDKEIFDKYSGLKTCNLPNNGYNFFIHFVDKYGKITNGFQIGEFINNLKENYGDNDRGEPIVYNNYYNLINLSIDNLPTGYVGYFVSYESLIPYTKIRGYVEVKDVTIKDNNDNSPSNTIKEFYIKTEEINVNDIIDLDIDNVRIFDKNNNEIGWCNVDKIEIIPANGYKNKGYNSKIKVTVGKLSSFPTQLDDNTIYYRCELYHTNSKTYYTSEIKKLIPCSNINYDITKKVNINTNTAFYSNQLYIDFNNVFFDDSVVAFKHYIQVTGTDADNNDTVTSAKKIAYPWTIVNLGFYNTLPYSSYRFKNPPTNKVFPLDGLDTTDPDEKTFAPGVVVDPANIIDLYEQPNVPYYENYPKIYTNFREDNTYDNKFPKTIRRSNVISDESTNVSWRFFETDNYKNIIENKGAIIKLTSIGNIMFVHTEHSLFQFNCDNTLKDTDNNKIAIGNIDIWEINYREVLTSEFGYGGLANPNHAIVGSFGYIFYEQDNKRFFKYDNNSIVQIDEDINKYIREKDTDDVFLVDDVYRNRIIIKLYDEYLTYNYKYNSFVSFHDYTFNIGYNTKTKIYLFDGAHCFTFDNDSYIIDCFANIIVNDNYYANKLVTNIDYIINKIINPITWIRDSFYSGDIIRIKSEECDTGDLLVYINNPKETINSVRNPNKPYRELGKWNFNYIRNRISTKPISDNASMVYGNWFIVNFTFNNTENKCIELESLNCYFKRNLT